MSDRRPAILVVDDDALHLDAALDLCEALGFGFVGARTLADALRLAGEAAFSAVLVDWDLPDRGGPALARRLRDAGRDALVVAVVAAPDDEARARCLADGADDLLARPIGRAELASCLQRLATPPELGLLDTAAVAAMRRLGLLEHLYPAYFTFVSAEIARLKEAIAREDRTAIRNLAHRIRGSSAQLGASLLVQLLSDIESAAARAGALHVPHSDAELDEVTEATIAAMTRELEATH